MNNRYNELTKEQQDKFDHMINKVASHNFAIATRLTSMTYLFLLDTERELWTEETVKQINDINNDMSWYAAGAQPGQSPKRSTSKKARK